MKAAYMILLVTLIVCAFAADIMAGFGCPNQYACHNHCRVTGFTGGYCQGFLKLQCKCYR